MEIDKFQAGARSLNVAEAAARVIEKIKKSQRLDEEGEYRIRLVLNELLNNVVEHSNATKVEVRTSLDENTVLLTITDNGDGFRYDDIIGQDVTEGSGLMQESGRGVFIVKTVSDNFRYNDVGNSVQVELSCLG